MREFSSGLDTKLNYGQNLSSLLGISTAFVDPIGTPTLDAKQMNRLLEIHSTSRSGKGSSTTSRFGLKWNAVSQGSQTYSRTLYRIAWNRLHSLRPLRLVFSKLPDSYLIILQYLYLLFDEENPLHSDDSNYVFTTEGHILTLEPQYTKPMSAVRRKLRGAENHQCPTYSPGSTFQKHPNLGQGIVGGVRSRRDVEYARYLTDGTASELERAAWSPYGFCDIPKVEIFVRLCHDLLTTQRLKRLIPVLRLRPVS